MIAPPLPPGELFKRADLVGHARVLSVDNLRLRAHLRFTKLLKGRPPQTGFLGLFGLCRDATVKIKGRMRFPKLGDWDHLDAYVPGERIKIFLFWSAGEDAYEVVWYNAIDRL
jgi:hypothetical protein